MATKLTTNHDQLAREGSAASTSVPFVPGPHCAVAALGGARLDVDRSNRAYEASARRAKTVIVDAVRPGNHPTMRSSNWETGSQHAAKNARVREAKATRPNEARIPWSRPSNASPAK